MRRRFALLELALAATALTWSSTACQQAPTSSRTPPTPTAGAPAPTYAPMPPRLLEGSFMAVSTTAMGITGDLRLSVTALKFSKGLDYETTPAANLEGTGIYAKNAGTWVDLLGVEPRTPVEVRAVSSEHVSAQAANGGLCAPERTTFVALASKSGATTPSLLLAAFKSPERPGPTINGSDLCGTFTYAAR